MLLPSSKMMAYTVLALAVWTLLCWIASVERRLSNLEEDVLIATTAPIIVTPGAINGMCGPCTTKFHVAHGGNLIPLPLELRAVPSFQ